ncbi:MAG: flagellar hook-length control protein FliK, partial [Paracoccaceae bacterium]
RTSDLNSLPDPYDDGGLFDAPAPHRTFDSTVGDPLFGSVVPGIGVSDEPMHAHPGIIAGTVPNPEANEDVEAMTPSSEDPRSRFDVRRSGALANSEPSVPVPAPDEAEAGLLRGDGSLAAAVQLKTDAGFHLPATNVPALSLSSNNETHPFVMQYGWRGSVIQQTKVDGTLALHQAADAPGSVERKGVANVPRADGGSSTFETLTPAPNKDSIFALMPAQSLLSTSLHGPAASTVAPYQVPQTIVEFVQRGAGDPVELLLRPDELGRLKFEMTTGGERVHVTLFVERPESMDLIRRYSDQLLQDLRQSGFSQPSLSFGDWSQRGSKPEHITLSPSALEPKAADVEATLLLSSAGSDVATGRLDLRL